jgi:hypothetical protein
MSKTEQLLDILANFYAAKRANVDILAVTKRSLRVGTVSV